MKSDTQSQRWATWFLSREGNNAYEIHHRLQNVCGDGAPSVRTVQRWVASFAAGRVSTEDEPRSGRPPHVVTQDTIERTARLITEDPRITTRELSDSLDISTERVREILHQHLNVNKVTARWVPKALTPEMKLERIRMSEELLRLEARH